MKQLWENKVQLGWELGAFACKISPVGICPGFATVCEWQERRGPGTNRGWSEVLPGFVSADQTDESEEPRHKAERGAGTRGALQPPSPRRGWR